MIKQTISLSFVAIFFSSCVSLAPKLELNKNEIIPNELRNSENSDKSSQITLDGFIENENLKNIVNF